MSQELQPLATVVEDPAGSPSGWAGRAAVQSGENSTGAGGGRRFRLIPHTLTSRLLAGVVAVVLVVVVATGVATYFSLHSYLYGRLDKQVTTSLQGPQIQRALSPDAFGGVGPSPQKVWLAVLNGSTGTAYQISGSNRSTVDMELSAAERADVLRAIGRHETITTTDGTQLRIVSESQTYTVNGVPTDIVFVVGLSTDEITRTMNTLIVIELIIGAGAVLLAFGATAWGVRVSLGPLRRVTRTAQEVTAELSPNGSGLDRRVPETDNLSEVGQLASSFNAMLDTVELEFAARRESEERMRQFLADASHELRTPLTSIRGYAELSRLRSARMIAGGAPAAADGDDTLARIEAEGTRMSRLVEDLLLLARGDDSAEGHVATLHERVALAPVIADAVAGVEAAHPDRRITAEVSDNLTVVGDRDQLLRVLRNLITNAAIHTDPRGPIRVVGRRLDQQILIDVIDAGPGMPPDEAAHVFERFWRADKARTRVRGGSGLGMAIVAQIVEAHNGTVRFDSSVSDGSTVTVTFPAAPAAQSW